MPRYAVKISHHDLNAMMDLVRVYHLDVSDHGHSRGTDGEPHVAYANVTAEQMQTLRDAGYAVQQFFDVDTHNLAAQAQVGKGNRYKKRS
jgi:hypothetical protein